MKGNTKGSRLYWAVGILLVFVLLSTWMACGLFAKYVTADADDDTARVAATGVVQFDVLEHEATPDKAKVYELLDGEEDRELSEVKQNFYQTIPPGFDIPKDPFVRLELKDSEVDYHLYLSVIKSANFPEDTVTFYLTDDWKPVKTEGNVTEYLYVGDFHDEVNDVDVTKGYFDAGMFKGDISILKNDTVYISEHYKGEAFNISFEARLVQID